MDEDARPPMSIMPNSTRTSAESINITAPGRDMIVSPNSSAGSSNVSIQLFLMNGETPIQSLTSAEGLSRVGRTSLDTETRSGVEEGTARDGGGQDTEPRASFSMWRIVRFFSNFIGRNTEGSSLRPTPASSSASIDTTTTASTGMVDSDRESVITLESIGEPDEGSAQPRSRAFHEIYVLKLLGTGYGLPCWEPGPSPPEIVPRGVVPGDVGTYTTEWGFDKSFNLWDDKDALQQLAARHSVGPYQALTGQVRTRHNALRPGTVFSPGAACDSRPLPRSFGDYFVLHEFRYRSTPGAILALVSSADCEIIDDIEAMQSYILRNPEAIYRHANSIRRPIGGHASLYVITGCLKTDAWAMAAYQELPADEYDRLRISELSRTDPVGSDRLSNSYQWTKTAASSHARLGDSGVEGLKDQALFLQGFKLTFSPEFIQRMNEKSTSNSSDRAEDEFEDGTGQDDPDPPDSNPPASDPGPEGENNNSSNSHEQQADPSSDTMPSTMNCSQFPLGSGTPHHPCDAINDLLLKQTGAELALSHDDDWRYLLRSATSDLYSAAASSNGHMEVDGASEANASGSCSARLDDGFEAPPMPEIRTASVRNGVAYLLPPEHSVVNHYQGSASSSVADKTGRNRELMFGPSRILKEGEPPGSPAAPKSTQGRWFRGIPRNIRSIRPHPSSRGSDTSLPHSSLARKGQPDDMVIIVMGPTGVGKSRFINEYLGKEVVPMGRGMEVCTHEISYHPYILPDSHPTCPGRRLVLIDTPGFDNTYVTEYEAFRRTVVGLASTYDNKLRVASVIYLTSIPKKHVSGSMRLDYELFRGLCGEQAVPIVTVATTHWDSAELESPGAGVLREEELRSTLWKETLDAGAVLERVQDYTVDPERIVNGILGRAQEKEVATIEFQVQQELVDRLNKVPKTRVSKMRRYRPEAFEKMLKPVEIDIEKERERFLLMKEKMEALELEVSWVDRFKHTFANKLKKGGGGSKRMNDEPPLGKDGSSSKLSQGAPPAFRLRYNEL